MSNNGYDIESIVLVGVGGQGILLASEIIAQAAMAQGFDVKTNEVHGMAQRGGSVVAQIRYGEKVYSPLVERGCARVLCSLERIEALRYRDYLAAGGLAVVSSQILIPVTVSSGAAEYPEDAPRRLREAFPRLVYFDAVALGESAGSGKSANTVLLGALSNELGLSVESWYAAIEKSVKPRFADMNKRAFDAGREIRI